MRIYVYLCLACLTPFSLFAQKCPEELKSTLREYYIQNWGQRYVDSGGGIPEPSASKTCEKIRYDMRYWRCQGAGNPPRKGLNLETDALGVPHIVKSAQKVKPHLVGGVAAKQRNIARSWDLYRRELAKYQADVLRSRQATVAYKTLHQELVVNGCKHGLFNGVHSERDPILNPGR